jgi:hypothetical protein
MGVNKGIVPRNEGLVFHRAQFLCGAGDSHRRESHGKHRGQRELQFQNAIGHLDPDRDSHR